MTIRHMRIFASLYENNGNMTKTAEALFMTQPAISAALSEMESYYGCKLFDRVSRKLYINSAGTKYYGYVRRILNMINDMEIGMEDLKGHQSLRIGCCDTMDACGLPKYISGFMEIHPGIKIRSWVDTGDGLIDKILNNELDLAIIDKECVNKKIVSVDFMAADMTFAAAPKLGYQEGQTISVSELVKQPLLFREKGSGARSVVDEALRRHGHQVEPAWESVGNVFVLNAGIRGMGLCCLPKNIMEPYHRSGKLVYLHVEGLNLKLYYKIIRHVDKDSTKVIQDFIKMCQDFQESL